MNSFSSSYYFALTGGYTIGLLGWWLIHRWKPQLWNSDPEYNFLHPWWDTLWAFLAALTTIAIGQLYSGGTLLPKGSIVNSELTEALNQIIIFLPFILLLIMRRQPSTTAWLSSRHLATRLAIGLILGITAICVFVLIRRPSASLGTILGNVYHPKNAGYATQILLEDIAIAVVFVRFRSAVGAKWFLIVLIAVAFLFSASHYPAKLSEGLSFMTATRDVLIDGALVSAVIYVLQRSRDIVWFWFIHFAMDMMQFYTGSTSL
jgi:hypothetical protein